MPWTESYLHKLEEYVSAGFPTLKACYELSEKTLDDLTETVGGMLPAEASFVVFGSLARRTSPRAATSIGA